MRLIQILSSVSAVALLPAAALAQAPTSAPADSTPSTQQDQTSTDATVAPTNAAGQPQPQGDIVVTGSRVRRDTFSTPSPVDVVTRDERILAGSRSTAEVLQSATVTSGTSQLNGAFLGFVSPGGPASDSVGLRGLAPNRTLVLLNGRRLAPAGVGPQLISADLNVLPTSAVQRIEVLREGASSVYGSDAIAGVINVITDTSVNGIVVDAFTDQPTQYTADGGRTYRASLTAGHVFDRGHIMVSFEYRERTGLRVGDRPEYSCPRDLFFNAAGTEVGQIDPATGGLSCFSYVTNGGSGTAGGYGIAVNFATGAQNRITFDNGDLSTFRNVNGLTRTSPGRAQLEAHIISPVRTYTGYANASYELGALGDAELYGEALFTRRISHQDAIYQFNYNGNGLSPNNEVYGGTYAGVPISAFGYPMSPFYPNSVANAGYNEFVPFVLPDRPYASSQRIDFVRANGGLRGHLGIGDWRYDANFQYSHTNAVNHLTQIEVSHLNNVLQTVIAPPGTPADRITVALPGQAGAGKSYTCASNVSATGAFIAGSTCVPLNWYDPDVMVNGHVPRNVYDYLFSDNVSSTTFTQETASLNLDGTLLNLPAGPVRLAIGFEHRFDHIRDVPSPAQQAGDLYNYSSGGITQGSDKVDEVYGEVNIPLLRDRPFFHVLELDGSVRYTHYRSYGSDVTYHLNAQWAPVDVLRFRGNYGTSFRAPNLYEQYVADQTGFYPSANDPCTGFGSLPTTSQLYINCLAALTPILGAGATGFIATAGPQVTTRGGAGNLKAEHSTSYGFGAVITLPRRIADLSLAVDYFNIAVNGEVAVLGSLILNRCYEASDFGPGNPYCALIDPRLPATDPQRGNLASFLNPYLNVARQTVSGIDFDLRYATPLAGGRFVMQARATRNIHQTFQLFSTDASFDYNGTPGVQGFGAGPKWVGSLDLHYTFPDDVTVRWGVQYVGPQSADKLANADPPVTQPAPAPLVGNIFTDLHAGPYFNHGVSVQFRWRDVGQVTMGVNNVFNRLPPVISSYPNSAGQFVRVGNYLNSSNYDLLGRSFFLNVTRQF